MRLRQSPCIGTVAPRARRWPDKRTFEARWSTHLLPSSSTHTSASSAWGRSAPPYAIVQGAVQAVPSRLVGCRRQGAPTGHLERSDALAPPALRAGLRGGGRRSEKRLCSSARPAIPARRTSAYMTAVKASWHVRQVSTHRPRARQRAPERTPSISRSRWPGARRRTSGARRPAARRASSSHRRTPKPGARFRGQ